MTEELKVVGQELWLQHRPHPAQLPFHQDRYLVPWRVLLGGTGSGKTRAGVWESIQWCLANQGFVGAIYEPTYNMVKKTIIPMLERYFGYPIESCPAIEYFNRSDLVLRFAQTGSTLWLGSLDEPEHAEGQNLDFVYLDEARLVPHLETALKVLLRRLRGSSQTRYIGGWITTTPDAPGSELHKAVEDPKTKLKGVRVYRMSIYDNIYLTKSYIDSIVAAHSGGLAERFVEGRFAQVESGSFSFDITVHCFEAWKDPASFREIRYGVDFGWTNPTAIVVVGFDSDGRAHVLDEVYEKQMRTADMVEHLKSLKEKYGDGLVVCDRSEPGTIDELNREALRAMPYEVKREDGIRQLGDRFQRAGDGRPRIFIRSNCVNLISELQSYSAEIKENDHAVDALRYAVAGHAFASGRASIGRIGV